MTAASNKDLVRRYLDALRVDKSPATLDHFVAEQNLKQHIALYEASFPGYWIDAEELIAEDDRVAVRGVVRGVHTGDLMGIPPTGREVAVPLFITYRIQHERIVEHWMLVDVPALLQQLGQAPVPAHA
jgi:predicted ester cyclase